MKIFLVENNCSHFDEDKAISWRFLADSAYTNTGKPFYIPEAYNEVDIRLGMAFKISRLGKTINEKFSRRYYSHFAPAVSFVIKDLQRKLQNENLTDDPAFSFDRSIVVADFIPLNEYTEIEDTISLFINNTPALQWSLSDLRLSTDKVITEISRLNTLKMGDILVPGISEGAKIEIGDKIEVKIKDECIFTVKIK